MSLPTDLKDYAASKHASQEAAEWCIGWGGACLCGFAFWVFVAWLVS